jgi:hypothetical protein
LYSPNVGECRAYPTRRSYSRRLVPRGANPERESHLGGGSLGDSLEHPGRPIANGADCERATELSTSWRFALVGRSPIDSGSSCGRIRPEELVASGRGTCRRPRKAAGRAGCSCCRPVYGLQNRRLADATGGFRRRRRWRRDDNPNTGTAERHREFSRSIRASGGSPVSAPVWGETITETRVTQTLAEIGVKYASVAMKVLDRA